MLIGPTPWISDGQLPGVSCGGRMGADSQAEIKPDRYLDHVRVYRATKFTLSLELSLTARSTSIRSY